MSEQSKYFSLNKFAEPCGTVIFGGTEDKAIPLCELKQAFNLPSRIYNRSFDNLSVFNSVELFNLCVRPLSPERIFLHVGQADVSAFESNPSAFDSALRTLINTIRTSDKSCELVIVSLDNPQSSPIVTDLNTHLKNISSSENCPFVSIAPGRAWNFRQTKDVVDFLSRTGFDIKRSLYDITKILFCYNAAV